MTTSNEILDLNTVTKEEFVSHLICSEDADGFYIPREKELLSLNFDFDQMKIDFEQWMEENCDNKF